jgi:hypothetical protein
MARQLPRQAPAPDAELMSAALRQPLTASATQRGSLDPLVLALTRALDRQALVRATGQRDDLAG